MRLLGTREPQRVQAQLASQPHFGRLAVGIMRTLEDADGTRYAVLRLDAPDIEARQVRLDEGQSVELPGHGLLAVEAVEPATRERRGWVTLAFTPA